MFLSFDLSSQRTDRTHYQEVICEARRFLKAPRRQSTGIHSFCGLGMTYRGQNAGLLHMRLFVMIGSIISNYDSFRIDVSDRESIEYKRNQAGRYKDIRIQRSRP
jgi:hypothetical protein